MLVAKIMQTESKIKCIHSFFYAKAQLIFTFMVKKQKNR